MPLDLSALEAAVEKDKTVNQSAIDLITGLAQKVRETAGDPLKVEALAAALEANSQDLADAIVANTPSEPPPA